MDTQETKVEFGIRSIALNDFSFTIPPGKVDISNLNHNIGIESKVDTLNKNIIITVSVVVLDSTQTVQLGVVKASCIYAVNKLDEMINDGKLNVSEGFIHTLNSISISTMRGIMFSLFRGTFLHNATLPIVDPKQFQIIPSEMFSPQT